MAMPNLFVIGAAKAGTTSLCSMLDRHPDVSMGTVKEPHFFSADIDHERALDDYLRMYDTGGATRITGDGSTSYSRLRYHPRTIERIKAYSPHAKIIYMVRHPLRRMESAYCEHLTVPNRPVTWSSVNDAVSSMPMIVDSSRYWEVFDAYRTAFGDASVKVVWFEEYASDPLGTFTDIARFLAIDDSIVVPPETQHVNGRQDTMRRMRAQGVTLEPNLSWSPDVLELVREQLGDDLRTFLAHFGRERDFWPGMFTGDGVRPAEPRA